MFTVTALFTQSTGEPATGLALADIDLYLYRRIRATGVVSTVWTAQNPTEEIGGGLYCKTYTGEDTATYEYFGCGQYTGVTVLDSNYALQIGASFDDQAIWSSATRTLTSTAAATAAAVSGSDLTITIAATYAATLSGMTISATWTKCYLTIKASATEVDAASVLQLVVTNPAAAGTDGVLYVEGVAATTAQRTMGSLTVNQVAGTVAIALSDDLTAALHAHGNLVYDIKTVLAAGSSTVNTTAYATVGYTPTRTV